MKKIKVANIIEEAKIGGPQMRIILVAKSIDQFVDTTIIMPKLDSESFRELCEYHNINYKQVKISKINSELKNIFLYIFFSFTEIFNLSNLINQEKYDLVHVSGGSWQFKGVIAGKISKTKVVWHLNDTYTPFIVRLIFKQISNLTDSFIYSSKKTKNYYRKYLKHVNQEFIIPPPVDTNHFNPRNNDLMKDIFKENFDDSIVIGTIANISPIKGLECMIKFANNLNKYYKSIIYIVIGNVFKRQEKYFKLLMSITSRLNMNNFYFYKNVNDIRILLKKFDIYVCTSLNESGPMSLWEGMSMEKPIITTDVGDVNEYIKDEENGFIVPVNDYQTMADKAKILISDKKLRKRMGSRSRKIVIDNLDLKICSRKHLNAYKSLVIN